MEADVTSWIGRGVVGLLIMAVGGLFARLRSVERDRAAADVRIEKLEQRPVPSSGPATKVHDELREFQIGVAENYVRRNDYIQQTAGILQRLDAVGTMTARIDERTRLAGGTPR